MKPSDVITTARYIILDYSDGISAPRQSDAELLGYFNDGIKEISTLQPMLFSTIGDMTCTPGKSEQAITFLDAARLLDVLCIHAGSAITSFDRASMDLFRPGWRADTPAPAQQWCPLEGDMLNFYIWPPAPTGQVLDVRYVRNSVVYAIGDTVADLPESYRPALVDYVVYRAESKDDENVLNQRAAGHYQAFLAKIGAK
jgi:hypothetical protein